MPGRNGRPRSLLHQPNSGTEILGKSHRISYLWTPSLRHRPPPPLYFVAGPVILLFCSQRAGLLGLSFSPSLIPSASHTPWEPLASAVLVLLPPPQPPILQVTTNEDVTFIISIQNIPPLIPPCAQHPPCHNSSLPASRPLSPCPVWVRSQSYNQALDTLLETLAAHPLQLYSTSCFIPSPASLGCFHQHTGHSLTHLLK